MKQFPQQLFAIDMHNAHPRSRSPTQQKELDVPGDLPYKIGNVAKIND